MGQNFYQGPAARQTPKIDLLETLYAPSPKAHNALRHGLTGQTVVLPSEDLAPYQKHCGELHTELKPL